MVSKSMIYRALSDKAYLSLGLPYPLISSVREERANFSAIDFSYFCGFRSEKFISSGFPLGAKDKLRYFIVALPVPSI